MLEGFEIGRKEAEDLIMAARIHAGWITAEDLMEPEVEEPVETEDDSAVAEDGAAQESGGETPPATA